MKRTVLDNLKQIKDTHIENLEPEAKEYRISCDSRLYFRVSSKGKKSWGVCYKDSANKWKWHSIESYPQLLLTDAKLEAANIFIKLRNKEQILTQKQIELKRIHDQELSPSNLLVCSICNIRFCVVKPPY